MPREGGLREEPRGECSRGKRGAFMPSSLSIFLPSISPSPYLPVSVSPCCSTLPDGLAHTPRVGPDRGYHQPWKLQAVGGGLPDKI